jgi:hypothetical protein
LNFVRLLVPNEHLNLFAEIHRKGQKRKHNTGRK